MRYALPVQEIPGATVYNADDIDGRDNNKPEQAEDDEQAVDRTHVQLGDPGALGNAEAAQLHRANDIFRSHNRADDDGDDHRSQAGNFAEDAAAQLIDFEAASALRIQRDTEVSCQSWHETQREVDGIGDLVGYAQAAETDAQVSGVGGVRDWDGK